jgi:FkbM family methyltransferase
MSARQRAKELIKDTFPSAWLHWHFMHRPKTAECELAMLAKVVPRGAVTIDVGANCGLYTRKLARLSERVHAFEPSHTMADLLRRTSASNVRIYELALSDRTGHAELFTPQSGREPVYGLASLERREATADQHVVAAEVPMARLDAIVQEDVAFVKVDVEGHELNVLDGAVDLVERSQPVFLVEAEDRHRAQATALVFAFFRERSYRGYFLKDGGIYPVHQFDAGELQDPAALLSDGGRKPGRCYINNFFFFPQHLDGRSILSS